MIKRNALKYVSTHSPTTRAGGCKRAEGDVERWRRETDGHIQCVCLTGLEMKVNTHFLGARRHMTHEASAVNSGFERGKELTPHPQAGKCGRLSSCVMSSRRRIRNVCSSWPHQDSLSRSTFFFSF